MNYWKTGAAENRKEDEYLPVKCTVGGAPIKVIELRIFIAPHRICTVNHNINHSDKTPPGLIVNRQASGREFRWLLEWSKQVDGAVQQFLIFK